MPTSTKRQHFVDGDLVMSHFISVLSATFPEGEDFFIRSVRNFQSSIDDPQLETAVKGFIGQEATHRHQHRLLNERLQVMGYPTARIDRHVARLIKRLERRFSPEMRLSMTSALEHYTATLAEIILTSEDAQKLIGQTEVRPILLWHAFEESEHKAVAFDVYRLVGGTERTRVRGMRIASVILFGELILQTALSMAADKASYNPVTLVRSLYRFSRTPMFTADALRRFRSYNRPGFHPDDWDSAAVLERWSKELFDQNGSQRVIAQSG
ncbi:putative metal-dependent hydrolase [Mycobacteroides abscessus]|nr:metal-dependent hydrolase [Mycobacteroides abscessus subsp. bolletii 2B-0626]EIV12719.1 metal-dependent hydrolase [Mycobacteroides abscessus subsp. bolletii 2B-0307]ESV59890.1 putative metal-dependent hydrolase family protein [Mycobacteroides abscessus MAB_082312_2258]ESV63183.1 putative metal-dependent hydrolase family protein [Mycobacteroides abscessus MAB_091912_2446]ETZ76726.1 putative metal-dependent hydrolase family protein [Mycobacteroides abscessus MAB_082312_2272]CPU21781.1 putativ